MDVTYLKFSFGVEPFLGRAVLEQDYFLIAILPEIGKICCAFRAGNMRQRKMLGLGLGDKCFLVCIRPRLPPLVVFIANRFPSEHTLFCYKSCLSWWEIRLYATHSAWFRSFLGSIMVALMKEKCGTYSWPHTNWMLIRNWLNLFLPFLGHTVSCFISSLGVSYTLWYLKTNFP